MAYRSVIDIDINDEKFSEFLSKFEKFAKDAKGIPEPFQKMDKKISAAREGFGKLGGHLKRHMRESAGTTKDFTVELHHAGQRMATLTARVSQGRKELSQMGETGRKTFGIIARAGKDIFKAIPFIGGAVAGAGLAAVALYQHESNSILNRYKNSKFLGMKPGQVSAIDTQYQGVLANPAQSLAAMRQAEFTPAAFSFFARSIGKGWQKMSQTQMFDAELKRAKHVADQVSGSKAHQRAMLGIKDQIYAFNRVGLGVTDLELLKKTSWKTLNADIANAHKQAAAMNFSKATGRDMTKLAITISQKEVELSTDLSRTLAKDAPPMNTALNKLVNSVNWAANRINAALKGVVTGKAPTHGQGVVLDAAGKVYNYLNGPTSAIGKARMDMQAAKGMMERAENTSRYGAARAYYEKELSAYRKAKAAAYAPATHNAALSDLPPVVRAKAEKIAKQRGLYLNPQNWRPNNDPGDIDPMITVGKYHINAYEKFKTMGAAWRNMARTIKGYPVAHTVLAETRHYEGYKFHPKNAKQVANNAAIDQHAAAISGWMHVRENQKLNLNNANTLAALLTGLARWEQPHHQTPQELYHTIKRAIVDGLREGGNGTPAASVGAQIHMAAH